MAQKPPTERSGDYDYIGPNQYAKPVGKRDDGSIIWQAGPRSKKYNAGQIVSENYAKSVRGSISWRNRVKGLVANPKEETPDNYADAQQILSEFNELSDELNEAQRQDNQERIEEIEETLREKRASLGS